VLTRFAAAIRCGPAKRCRAQLTAAEVDKALTRGSYGAPTNTTRALRWAIACTRSVSNPETHTRLPRYARGRTGCH